MAETNDVCPECGTPVRLSPFGSGRPGGQLAPLISPVAAAAAPEADDALAYAKKLADFPDMGYSPNEQRIMALAQEVRRLQREVHALGQFCGRQAGAK